MEGIVYEAKGVKIISLDNFVTNEENRLVAGWIFTESSFPEKRMMELVNPAFFVDPSREPYEEMVRNYYGSIQDYRDFEADASVHIVSPRRWLAKGEVGMLFYGLAYWRDYATPSDIIKGTDLIVQGPQVIYDSEKGNVKVYGHPEKFHLSYYMSHPIERVFPLKEKEFFRLNKDNHLKLVK